MGAICGTPAAEEYSGHTKNQGKAGQSTGKDGDGSSGKTDTNQPFAGEVAIAGEVKIDDRGRIKYISSVGAVIMTTSNKPDGKPDAGGPGSASQGVLVLYVPENNVGLGMAFRDGQGSLFDKLWADDDVLKTARKTSGLGDIPWNTFFKCIASDTMKHKVKIQHSGTNNNYAITFNMGKDPKSTEPWTVTLNHIGKQPDEVHKRIIVPMTRMVQIKRALKEKEVRFAEVECELHIRNQVYYDKQQIITQQKPRLSSLRTKAGDTKRFLSVLTMQHQNKARRVERAKNDSAEQQMAPPGISISTLDLMYEKGGTQAFAHLDPALPHTPMQRPMDEVIVASVTALFPEGGGNTDEKADKTMTITERIKSVPSSSHITRLMETWDGDRRQVEACLTTFKDVDDWNFNVFELEEASGGMALSVMTYALLQKLNLIDHFKIDRKTLQNFLSALQAGYHPNPYHNSIHAADVCHINYYVIVKAGLSDKCELSQEELLGAVIAGAIHDFDHPGFNNNFHTRTNAYLSTLYNDRSVLENHHCACVYELMRNPRFNIFANLDAGQKTTVRDTIIEMVLATDMGNHAKYFRSFRRRLLENADAGPRAWTEKEDVKLALAMSLKMADICNSGRPYHLYIQWAKRIAKEFYYQGDAECALELPISPFMDRKKEAEDFPKGQVSFMNFIVIPMFESVSEFLPDLQFTLTHCQNNQTFWQKRAQ